MIVDEPPYDLVALFADADIKSFVERIIERGQERGCVRPFRWRSLRDPRRDTMCHRPEGTLGPFLSGPARFLLVWDHHGLGRERMTPAKAEEATAAHLVEHGVAGDRILTLSFDPELEVLFAPAWDRVVAVLAERRNESPPSSDRLRDVVAAEYPDCAGLPMAKVFSRHPKECVDAAISAIRLRRSSVLFQSLGEKLSVPALKTPGSCMERLAARLRNWFPLPADSQPPAKC